MNIKESWESTFIGSVSIEFNLLRRMGPMNRIQCLLIMSRSLNIRNSVLSALKTSQKLEKKLKLEEALHCLSEAHEALEFPLRCKVAVRIASLCNKIAVTSPAKTEVLEQAEEVLMACFYICKKEKLPPSEDLVRTYASTLNNWATVQQKKNEFHLALNCLHKAVKLLEENPSKDVEFVTVFAKSRFNASCLCLEMRRYRDAAVEAEKALILLKKELKLRRLMNDKSIKSEKTYKDMICTYLCSYFNSGYAEGALGNTRKMKEFYYKALEISSPLLEKNHPLVLMVKKAYSEAFVAQSYSMTHNEPPESPTCERSSHVKSASSAQRSRKNSTFYCEEKILGSYYSTAELAELQKRLSEANTVKFISADEYFYTKITGLLDLSNEIRFLKDKDDKAFLQVTKEDELTRKKISELRLRKHFRRIPLDGKRLDHLNERIEQLKTLDHINGRKHDIQVKSKINTVARMKVELGTPSSSLKYGKHAEIQSEKTLKGFQTAKDEIAKMMNNIHTGFEKTEKTNKRRREKSDRKLCYLAKSALQPQKARNSVRCVTTGLTAKQRIGSKRVSII